MRRIFKRIAAFTLIELIVATALISIVIFGIASSTNILSNNSNDYAQRYAVTSSTQTTVNHILNNAAQAVGSSKANDEAVLLGTTLSQEDPGDSNAGNTFCIHQQPNGVDSWLCYSYEAAGNLTNQINWCNETYVPGQDPRGATSCDYAATHSGVKQNFLGTATNLPTPSFSKGLFSVTIQNALNNSAQASNSNPSFTKTSSIRAAGVSLCPPSQVICNACGGCSGSTPNCVNNNCVANCSDSSQSCGLNGNCSPCVGNVTCVNNVCQNNCSGPMGEANCTISSPTTNSGSNAVCNCNANYNGTASYLCSNGAFSVISNSCALNTCAGAVPANSTSCNGNTPAVNGTTYSVVASCGAVACTAGCNAGYYDNGGICSADTCQGAQPANSTLCAGQQTPVNETTNYTLAANCNGTTECQTTCNASGFYYNAGVCSADTCQGAQAAHSTLCAGQQTPVNETTNYTLAANCNGSTECQTTCNASGFYYNAGVCSADTCQGALPANSTLCAGQQTPLNDTTNYSLAASCNGTTECQTSCSGGFTYNAGVCSGNTCQGAQPAHSTLCAGQQSPVNDTTNYTLAASCNGTTECQTSCSAGFYDNAGVCSADTCQGGQPSNSTLCAGQQSPVNDTTNYTLAASCNGTTECQTSCSTGFTYNAGVCSGNACQGAQPANSTQCAGQQSPVNDTTNYTLAASCNGSTQCQTSCSAGFWYNAGVCSPDTCQGGQPANSTLCAGQQSPVNDTTNYTLAASCNGTTECQTSCSAGFYDNAGVCSADTCQGAQPANSTLCAGQQTPVNETTDYTLAASCNGTTECQTTCNASGYYYNAGVCSPDTCQGAQPAHSTVCVGQQTPVNETTDYTLAASCNGTTECQTSCSTGFTYNAGVCSGNACQGAQPANSTQCAGQQSPVNDTTNYTLAASCNGSTQCQTSCSAGFWYNAGVCSPDTCQGGQPANSTLCAGQQSPVNDTTNYTLAANCNGSTECQTICNASGFYYNAGVCSPDTCQGGQPAHSTLCAGQQSPVNDTTNYTLAASCNGTTECQTSCSAGFWYNAGVCSPDTCQGGQPANSTLCAGQQSPVNDTTNYTLAASCNGTTECQTSCSVGYYYNAGVCSPDTCINLPANSTSCNANLPGSNNTPYSVVASCGAGACTSYCNSGYSQSGNTCIPNCAGTDLSCGLNGVCATCNAANPNCVGNVCSPVCNAPAPSCSNLTTSGSWSNGSGSCTLQYSGPCWTCTIFACPAGTCTLTNEGTITTSPNPGDPKCPSDLGCYSGPACGGSCNACKFTGCYGPQGCSGYSCQNNSCGGVCCAVGQTECNDTTGNCCTPNGSCSGACGGGLGYDNCGYPCTNSSLCNTCQGTQPANSTLCAGQQSPVNDTTNYTLAASCNGTTECQTTCTGTYYYNAGVCTAYTCHGSPLPYTTLCPLQSPTNNTTNYTLAATCDGVTQCQTVCNGMICGSICLPPNGTLGTFVCSPVGNVPCETSSPDTSIYSGPGAGNVFCGFGPSQDQCMCASTSGLACAGSQVPC